MKSNCFNRIALITTTTVALGFLLASSGSAVAQYKLIGDDGIAASPKYRQILDAQKQQTSAPELAHKSMAACADCKDYVTARTDLTARGAKKPTISVATHLCPACTTSWQTVGVSKAKQSVAYHTCGGCVTAKR